MSVVADREIMEEISGSPSTLETARVAVGGESVDRLVHGETNAVRSGTLTQAEAIILLHGRPALLVQDHKWEDPKSKVISDRIGDPSSLKSAISAVGRVEIIDYGLDYVGTGWMVDTNVLITNRHVAEIFARAIGDSFGFRTDPEGNLYETRVDFRQEYDRTDIHQARVESVVLLEKPGDFYPDLALVQLAMDGAKLPPPVELDNSPLRFDPQQPMELAVVGYPAEDSRNDSFEMRRIFKDIFNVKRFSPGRLMGVRSDAKLLEHDCTTLGGNSGSLVLNLATRKACGLHFAGSYRDRNYAVTSHWIKARLHELESRLVLLPAAPPLLPTERVPELDQRNGYDPTFLGSDPEHEVPRPSLAGWQKGKVAAVRGNADGELKYTHFSVLMRSDRRLPFFTAVNIDGNKLFNFPRGKDAWYLDPRLPDQAHQIGPELYTGNKLDRGHLVRRLDPAWGETREEAKQAELDTFFYTNSSPQHAKLNQKTWLSLEDYVLSNAETHALRVSVFTGPVFAESDPDYRGVQIPQEFWKVVVIVHESTGDLSATAYLLSQGDYMDDIEFVFGEFKTYQVPVSTIEEKTEMAFGLEDFDPLNRVEGPVTRVIRDAADIVL